MFGIGKGLLCFMGLNFLIACLPFQSPDAGLEAMTAECFISLYLRSCKGFKIGPSLKIAVPLRNPTEGLM